MLSFLSAAFFFFGQQRTASVSIAPSGGSLHLCRQHSAFSSLFIGSILSYVASLLLFSANFLFCFCNLLVLLAAYIFCILTSLYVGRILLLSVCFPISRQPSSYADTFTFSRLDSLLFLLTAFVFCMQPSTYVGIHLLLPAFFSFVGIFFVSRQPSSVNSLFFCWQQTPDDVILLLQLAVFLFYR